MKKNYTIILSSLCISLLSFKADAELNCTEAPDCGSLGYTMSTDECKGLQMAKCPTDSTKVFCKKSLTETSSGISSQIKPVTCAVGSILGGNGLCYATELPADVLPVAVVFDTGNRLAVALTHIGEDGTSGSSSVKWATEEGNTALTDCSGNYEACDTDGRANTNVILKATGGGTYPAAQAVNKYEPEGCTADFCKKTKWFIPSVKEWKTIYKQYFKVGAGLVIAALGQMDFDKIGLEGYNNLSSNECTDGKVLSVSMVDGALSCYGRTYTSTLRPVVKY